MFTKRYLLTLNYADYPNSEKSNANLEISQSYMKAELNNEAIYFANKAYEFNPKNVESLYTRGEIYYLLEEKDLAISDIEAYVDLGNPRGKAYKLLSEIYNKKGDIIKSRYYLEKR